MSKRVLDADINSVTDLVGPPAVDALCGPEHDMMQQLQ